jgi:hypothetical protein
MYRIVLKWVVLIGVRTEGVGISLSITLHDTWFDCLWNNWLIPAQHKWLSIAKHKEANKQAKYFGIEEFWSPLMNTKTHLWKKSLRTPTTSFKNQLCGCRAWGTTEWLPKWPMLANRSSSELSECLFAMGVCQCVILSQRLQDSRCTAWS